MPFETDTTFSPTGKVGGQFPGVAWEQRGEETPLARLIEFAAAPPERPIVTANPAQELS